MNQPPTPTAQALRVLALDDEQDIRQVYQKALTSYGHSVTAAASGREALQLLMQQSFDVLVVDLAMEEMDGMVFLQEALKIWPWLSVIIVSGHLTPARVAAAKKLGVRRLLQKPVSLDEIHRNLAEAACESREPGHDIMGGHALSLLRDHLKLLMRLDRKNMAAETLAGALAEFGKTLAGMLPSDVLGILVVLGEEERTLLLHAANGVTEDLLATVQREMLTRFSTLSGYELGQNSLTVRAEGEPCIASGPDTLGSTLSVPILLDREVCGLLTLARTGAEVYTPAHTSLLYHAANHISAVFMALRRMHTLATRDPLTGVFNRIRLEEELEHAWLISRRYGTDMAVVVADLDDFKTLNDSYGHNVGDEILRDFAEVLRHVARSTDIIARYGGDEFVAILPHANEDDARAFGERLLTRTREHVFCEKHHKLNLTLSIGISNSNSSAAPATSGEILSQADRALFMAKRAGRNRVCVWPGKAAEPQARTSAEEPGAGAKTAAKPSVPAQGRIVLVDDDPGILQLVTVMLTRDGFAVDSFESAPSALSALKARPDAYDILVTDINLPETDGIQLMHEVADQDDSIVRIVMTGQATVDNAIRCLREGAYDFIQKPVSREHLTSLMKRALEYRRLRIENERYTTRMEDMVRDRSAQLAASLEELKKSYEFTLETLVAMLDAREHHTGRHSTRVSELAVTLARKLGIGGPELDAIASGAMLHDIGKIGIPDAVLFKPGPLTDEEWHIMKRHPEIGRQILRRSIYLKDAMEIVYSHHEHYDGSGYPRGLQGENICVGARIFGIVDAYDAMRDTRVYRAAMSPEEACGEIRRSRGTQFDPKIAQVFLDSWDEFERILRAEDR